MVDVIYRHLGECFSLLGFQISADELDELKDFLYNEVKADFPADSENVGWLLRISRSRKDRWKIKQ
jgi:hypothetical protein